MLAAHDWVPLLHTSLYSLSCRLAMILILIYFNGSYSMLAYFMSPDRPKVDPENNRPKAKLSLYHHIIIDGSL